MITNRMIDSAYAAARAAADASGYGGWIKDDICRELGIAVLKRVDHDEGITPGHPRPTPPQPVPAPAPAPVAVPDSALSVAWHKFEELAAHLIAQYQKSQGQGPS